MKRFKDCLKDSMKRSHIRTETWQRGPDGDPWFIKACKSLKKKECDTETNLELAVRRLSSTDTPSDDLKCFCCDRICRSLIGLRSHQATHK